MNRLHLEYLSDGGNKVFHKYVMTLQLILTAVYSFLGLEGDKTVLYGSEIANQDCD